MVHAPMPLPVSPLLGRSDGARAVFLAMTSPRTARHWGTGQRWRGGGGHYLPAEWPHASRIVVSAPPPRPRRKMALITSGGCSSAALRPHSGSGGPVEDLFVWRRRVGITPHDGHRAVEVRYQRPRAGHRGARAGHSGAGHRGVHRGTHAHRGGDRGRGVSHVCTSGEGKPG